MIYYLSQIANIIYTSSHLYFSLDPRYPSLYATLNIIILRIFCDDLMFFPSILRTLCSSLNLFFSPNFSFFFFLRLPQFGRVASRWNALSRGAIDVHMCSIGSVHTVGSIRLVSVAIDSVGFAIGDTIGSIWCGRAGLMSVCSVGAIMSVGAIVSIGAIVSVGAVVSIGTIDPVSSISMPIAVSIRSVDLAVGSGVTEDVSDVALLMVLAG